MRSAGNLLRYPITGTPGCCALAPSGHAAAAPPSSVMNPRRFMASPSFDHLVGEGEQHGGHLSVRAVSALTISSNFDDCMTEVRRLGTLEDAAGADAELAIRIANVGSDTHPQMAPLFIWALCIGCPKNALAQWLTGVAGSRICAPPAGA